MNVGSGREALGFLQFNCKKIYHYDISQKRVLDFKKIIKKNKLNKIIISKRLDLSKDKLPREKFDLVYLNGIIQHVDHPGKAIINISRSIKKNGIFWLYFYRPGSLSTFLGSILRRLLFNRNKINFVKKLVKNNKNFRFKDDLLDEALVPNRHLFYPKTYLDFLKKCNFKIYGDSFLVNQYQSYNFKKFHFSSIFFLQKNRDKKICVNPNILKPSRSINVLNKSIYKKKDKIIKSLISLISKNDLMNEKIAFDKVIKIGLLRHQCILKYLKEKKLSSQYVKKILIKLKSILEK